MATNEILRFAETDTGTNLLTQAEYLADSQRPIGNQPGVARSKLVNKALRQASLIAAGLAEYIADNQANNITDALTPQNIADYLQAALTGALGVTPPQFDNDTSLATTAFVQRALGNYSGFVELTTSSTIAASDAGKAIITNQPASLTLTLPSAALVPVGSAINVSNIGTGSTILSTQSPDIIFAAGQSGVTSISLNSGESVSLVRDVSASQWKVAGGRFARGAGKTAQGFFVSEKGVIVQWGGVSLPDFAGNYTVNVTFPIAFPNSLFCVTSTPRLTGGFNTAISSTNWTLTGCALVASEWSAVVQTDGWASYIAIGY